MLWRAHRGHDVGVSFALVIPVGGILPPGGLAPTRQTRSARRARLLQQALGGSTSAAGHTRAGLPHDRGV